MTLAGHGVTSYEQFKLPGGVLGTFGKISERETQRGKKVPGF